MINLRQFIEFTDSVDDFIEKQVKEDGGVTTTSMPGASSLPQHAHAFPMNQKEGDEIRVQADKIPDLVPPNPNEVADEAMAIADLAKKVDQVAGGVPVPVAGAGYDYEPVDVPAPDDNIEIVPAEELNQ